MYRRKGEQTARVHPGWHEVVLPNREASEGSVDAFLGQLRLRINVPGTVRDGAWIMQEYVPSQENRNKLGVLGALLAVIIPLAAWAVLCAVVGLVAAQVVSVWLAAGIALVIGTAVFAGWTYTQGATTAA